MKGRFRRYGQSALLAVCLLTAASCSLPQMHSMEIDPPASGLLPYVREDDAFRMSDGGYVVEVERRTSGQDSAELLLQVRNSKGVPVEEFTEEMTELMHLIVVSRDLDYFNHVHPVYEGQGRFRTDIALPPGGDYLLVTEFVPDRTGPKIYKRWWRENGAPAREAVPLQADGIYSKTVSGIAFTLSVSPSFKELREGGMVMLNFGYRDSVTGDLIDLEPYLGTEGHCVIVSEEAQEYVHVHAVDGMVQAGQVMFHAEFPEAGLYKVWGQFQYRGEVLTVPFVIEVR